MFLFGFAQPVGHLLSAYKQRKDDETSVPICDETSVACAASPAPGCIARTHFRSSAPRCLHLLRRRMPGLCYSAFVAALGGCKPRALKFCVQLYGAGPKAVAKLEWHTRVSMANLLNEVTSHWRQIGGTTQRRGLIFARPE